MDIPGALPTEGVRTEHDEEVVAVPVQKALPPEALAGAWFEMVGKAHGCTG